ncbi:MAG: hypothetical protein A3I71_05715 [Omnitrophica WOR_2 bacterium RIFCSPLOWO2_02_FULL_63_16]|nr:MAG: hypothetical protein A2Z92_01505 [Omnitrophica WOR_2 bacterium GWA2_63_20]OGX16950.1 MAG: hypothetical protein A2105_00175 [Omnitrophica WOR_2 bacterium GWF2_63_9]OGX30780.1 MAG: hypothetical protein A3E56_04950 [Omnitrophica WOR_2 bacterium RIFCSPHIGHO2_12_FULL_64_13]OGX36050.1 MAG: hypothetical protein A3B73_04075 [Omnitrophica WOR_2 bacterium RIFCSPHIGHO2_02_FULL_63_39]OGX44135.1 MAG: hypothetical protein A3I71_05715 [Omnitrophica WOR_2 bacterium RIFCSPLOWO2_02_FULL_63_16]OGX49042.1
MVGLVAATVASGGIAGRIITWSSRWWRYDPRTLDVLCSAGAFLLVVLATCLLIRRCASWLERPRVPWFLRGLGLILGSVRGLWWAAVLLIFMLATGQPYLTRSIAERSLVGPQLVQVSRWGIRLVADRLPGRSSRPARSILLEPGPS